MDPGRPLRGFLRREDELLRGIGLAGCLAIILGAKFWLIVSIGSSIPFYDEWESARELYLPYINGTLTPGDLFAAHNEHLIFLTRVIHLALFAYTGYWDPISQMLVSAVVHVAAIGLLIVMLSRSLDRSGAMVLALFALVFAVPFGWPNTLAGFQVQFYLLILLGPLSLWVLYASEAFSPRWLIGTLLAALSYFSVASGALTLAAFIVLAGLQLMCGQRRGWREIAGIAAHVVLVVVIVRSIPTIEGHAGLGPKTLSGWIESAIVATSWPAAKPNWSLTLRAVTAAITYAPVIALTALLVWRAVPRRDPRWLVVAIAGFALVQILVLVHGRGLQVLEPRYRDLHLLGPLACTAALLTLWLHEAAERWRAGLVLVGLWLLLVLVAAGQKAMADLPHDLAHWRETTVARKENFTRYLATNDFAFLANKPQFHIPYPSAEYLRDVLAVPGVRSLLDPELTGGERPRNRVKNVILREGPLLIPIGFWLLLVAGLLAGWPARREPEAPR